MNLEKIQAELNTIFRQDSPYRKLVLWYDDKGTYADDIDALDLDDAEIIMLNGHNFIYSKYRIVRREREQNFLIYAPFPRPASDDETNHFLDIQYIAYPFYADALSDLCHELHIPMELKGLLQHQGTFWKRSANAEKWQALGLTHCTAQSLTRGVLAVLAGVKTIHMDEIVKAVLFTKDFASETNAKLKAFRKNGVEDDFWQALATEYGYVTAKPTLTGFLLHCLYSYFQQKTDMLPKSWQPVCQTNTAAVVFLSNMMTNVHDRDFIDGVLDQIGDKLAVQSLVRGADLTSYFSCDLFRPIDEELIRQFSTLVCTSPRRFSDAEMDCIHFRETTAHFAPVYLHVYKAVEYAYELSGAIGDFQGELPQTLAMEDMVEAYTQRWCNVDVYYRKFYDHYDQIQDKDLLGHLDDFVEAKYIHDYIEPLCAQWGGRLAQCKEYNNLPGLKQRDFFQHFVGYSRKEITVVIISDAMRYECGKELYERLGQDANLTPELHYMMANAPTYTQLGMASLLPNKQITIDPDRVGLPAFVDGQPTIGLENRQKLLQAAQPKARAMKLPDILAMTRAELRRELNDVRLLYVYHDTIDSTGDSQKTEDKVFAAATKSFDEILRCIRKLAADKGLHYFYVTADHGFLYRRSDLPSYTKVAYVTQGNEQFRNKRYIISPDKIEQPGVISWRLKHLGGRFDYMSVPMGSDIFTQKGGGQHFVHGGLSLQELVIPVVQAYHQKYKVETEKVSVKWYSARTQLTQYTTYLQFIQEEAVSDTKLPRTVTVTIEDEDGHQISNEVTIIADRTTTNAADRIYPGTLVLPEQRDYHNVPARLVIRDAEDGETLATYDIVIDVIQTPFTLELK